MKKVPQIEVTDVLSGGQGGFRIRKPGESIETLEEEVARLRAENEDLMRRVRAYEEERGVRREGGVQ